jgi:hypothetical protein
MSTIRNTSVGDAISDPAPIVPRLEPGDRLTRAEASAEHR